MALLSCSMTSAKSNGDNGHPCLVPLVRLNDIEFFLLVTKDAEDVLNRISLMKKGLKQRCEEKRTAYPVKCLFSI